MPRIKALIIATVVTLAAAPAFANSITISGTGHVTLINNAAFTDIALNAPISFSVTVDDSVSGVASPEGTKYSGALSAISFAFGTITGGAAPGAANYVNIQDGPPKPNDLINFNTLHAVAAGYPDDATTQFNMFFFEPIASGFLTSDSLAAALATNLMSYTNREISIDRLFFNDGALVSAVQRVDILGRIDSLTVTENAVPEPGTLLLMAAGLGALRKRSRK